MLYVLEVALYIGALAFIVTQIVLPGYRETALFPMFRTERKLEQKLVETHQYMREAALHTEIEEKLNKVSEKQ